MRRNIRDSLWIRMATAGLCLTLTAGCAAGSHAGSETAANSAAGAALSSDMTAADENTAKGEETQMTEDKRQTAADTEILVEESASGEIVTLEKGLQTAVYRGDDGFSDFLLRDGASSDREVLSYLQETLLQDIGVLDYFKSFFGCSTISVPQPDGGYYFGRNFDWNKCEALVLRSYPDDAYASISTVNLGFITQAAGLPLPDSAKVIAAVYAPLDGMNEKGLAVSVNMIQDRATIDARTHLPDITTTTAVRLLLNQAADTGEALALLQSYDMHASFGYMVHFAIADAAGNSVVVEYIDNEMTVIETPVLTNFYLAEGEKYGIGTSQSHKRFEILQGACGTYPQMNERQVRDTLASVSKGNFGEFESTEWSAVFDQKRMEAVYFHREDYTKCWRFVL